MTTEKNKPMMLMILDGWGYCEAEQGNAVALAKTPVLDSLWKEHPHTLIQASGLAVGLPEGQMGNSEVGHMNIGAGRTVYQSLTRITKSIKDGDFFTNPAFIGAMETACKPERSLHIMGLISPGGVHSHTDHLLALVELAKREGVSRVYIHAFLDGRDTPPRSADGYLAELEEGIEKIGLGKIVLISGRYYAMDRDNRWDRVQLAYDALTLGNGLSADSSKSAIEEAYERGENDEFVKPTNIHLEGEAPVTIHEGDAIIFLNFRPDRARELTRALTEPEFDGFKRERCFSNLYYVTMTEYDDSFSHVHVAYMPDRLDKTLGSYISSLGLKQLRIAETEKYAHVTFFFNGGVEEPDAGEDRILIPSPKVATYDLKPEMSAYEVGDRAVAEIKKGIYDLIILNFANMDMVGHTGILEAAIKAVEAVDENVGKIVKAVMDVGGQILLTADHGNSEEVSTDEGESMTAHTTNPVRLILIKNEDKVYSLADGGTLADLAPTLLGLMELPQPAEMTGHSLLRKG